MLLAGAEPGRGGAALLRFARRERLRPQDREPTSTDSSRLPWDKRLTFFEFAAGYGTATRHLPPFFPACEPDPPRNTRDRYGGVSANRARGSRRPVASTITEAFAIAGNKADIVYALSLRLAEARPTFGRWFARLYDGVKHGTLSHLDDARAQGDQEIRSWPTTSRRQAFTSSRSANESALDPKPSTVTMFEHGGLGDRSENLDAHEGAAGPLPRGVSVGSTTTSTIVAHF